MAVIRNPYDAGTPVPLPTYTGAPGDRRAMMKFKPWEDLIEQEVTFNPQWLPHLPYGMLPEEKIKDDIPIVKTIVPAGNGTNGTNGTNGNGTNGTNGTLTGINGNGDIIDLGGVVTGDVSAVDQGLIDAQAVADAQALLDEEAAAQALIDQQAADALAAQQAADAQAASDAILEQQRLEDDRIRQQQEDEAAAEDERIRQQEIQDEIDRQRELERIRQQELVDAQLAKLMQTAREQADEEKRREELERIQASEATQKEYVRQQQLQADRDRIAEETATAEALKEARDRALQFDLNYLTGISPSAGGDVSGSRITSYPTQHGWQFGGFR